MAQFKIISSANLVAINKMVCIAGGNPHQVLDEGKIESAIHAAFYPGNAPFQHGGIATVAGAIAFYVTNAHAFIDGNKRTALIASTVFMRLNMWMLNHPVGADADIIIAASSGVAKIDEVKNWYDMHKTEFSSK
jgi:death-on-curing protein